MRYILDGAAPGPLSLAISGTRGKVLVLNDARTVELWQANAGGSERWRRPASLVLPEDRGSPVLAALEDLVGAMEAGREPRCSERHAAQAMEMCLAVHASHRRGGQQVRFPIEDRDLAVDTW